MPHPHIYSCQGYLLSRCSTLAGVGVCMCVTCAAGACHALQDCCFSSSDPLIASALVSGQLLLHRYTAQQAPAGPAQQQQGSEAALEQQPAASTSYSVQQVLCRDSKKAASCRAVCFASDGSHLYCGFETGSILQLDPSSGKAVTRLTKAHSAGINRLLGIPEQPSLLAAGDMDGGLCIWDLRSQQHVLKYSKHSDYISGLTVSEKQQALLAVSGDGTLSVHDLRSCKVLARSEDDADDELMSGEALGLHSTCHLSLAVTLLVMCEAQL